MSNLTIMNITSLSFIFLFSLISSYHASLIAKLPLRSLPKRLHRSSIKSISSAAVESSGTSRAVNAVLFCSFFGGIGIGCACIAALSKVPPKDPKSPEYVFPLIHVESSDVSLFPVPIDFNYIRRRILEVDLETSDQSVEQIISYLKVAIKN